ncbi:rhodanese-like domain-containing protein [Pseudogemmobacter blasticus]|uniref:Rhodanese-like domain-containing protein n=1 Tax=Fuscovulum blasticum DSM 2131 TaxID=1188250 RepID=A0A2T4J6A3_FUSBL|nr:rhodanese-like domain-containing protein [Fuscovulum blasticum]PTE13422.1 rhodanese-like domain-containing protein [Fuscovulum blasticum DSM 2131]
MKLAMMRLALVAALAAAAPALRAGEAVEEALTVEQMQASGALVVDIRTPEEWAETGVIDGAKLVTFTDADSFLAAIGPEIADGRDLVLVCRSGRRSGIAAEALAEVIPNRVISQQGGMVGLVAGGYSPVPPG